MQLLRVQEPVAEVAGEQEAAAEPAAAEEVLTEESKTVDEVEAPVLEEPAAEAVEAAEPSHEIVQETPSKDITVQSSSVETQTPQCRGPTN